MSSRPTRPLLPGSGPVSGRRGGRRDDAGSYPLNDVEHEAFSRWLASTAVAVDPDNPHLEASEAISAMIRVAMRYSEITGQVASQLRLERTAAKDRKTPPIITGPDTIDRP